MEELAKNRKVIQKQYPAQQYHMDKKKVGTIDKHKNVGNVPAKVSHVPDNVGNVPAKVSHAPDSVGNVHRKQFDKTSTKYNKFIIQKTRGFIGLPKPEEELRILEEEANASYGEYKSALDVAAALDLDLESQMGNLKDEIAAMSKQLSEEQGNISVYTDRQSKALALKSSTEIELANEVKSHAGSIGAVKKDIEDIEQKKGNRDHTIKTLQDEIAEQDVVINKLNKEKKHLIFSLNQNKNRQIKDKKEEEETDVDESKSKTIETNKGNSQKIKKANCTQNRQLTSCR